MGDHRRMARVLPRAGCVWEERAGRRGRLMGWSGGLSRARTASTLPAGRVVARRRDAMARLGEARRGGLASAAPPVSRETPDVRRRVRRWARHVGGSRPGELSLPVGRSPFIRSRCVAKFRWQRPGSRCGWFGSWRIGQRAAAPARRAKDRRRVVAQQVSRETGLEAHRAPTPTRAGQCFRAVPQVARVTAALVTAVVVVALLCACPVTEVGHRAVRASRSKPLTGN